MSHYISCVTFFCPLSKLEKCTEENFVTYIHVNGVIFQSNFSKNFLKLRFSGNEIVQFRINMIITQSFET